MRIDELNKIIKECSKCRLSEMMKVLLEDCKWCPVCPVKRFYEDGILDKK